MSGFFFDFRITVLGYLPKASMWEMSLMFTQIKNQKSLISKLVRMDR